MEKRLKDFAEGKVVPKGMTVEVAVQEWYEFRDQNELDNTKAKLMGGKLVEWCEKSNILLLTALTTDKVIKWRLTLPFPSGDSSSLSVHWSVISGFFSWAAVMGYMEKSPIPNPKTKEAEDRLDEVQREAWLKMGLDENGNSKKQRVQ